jgi:4-diphosphocytidyl-2-C-methyl-D-erythritol kinase
MIGETAPAKINLYLHVTGRRADGYHLLESLVAFADFGDELAFEPAGRFVLEVTGPFAASLRDEPVTANLVTRAAHALAFRLGRTPDVLVRLDKRLPIASGLGGGSADAAATLRGLARLWSVSLDDPLLIDVARGLGQDVPVCLASRPAYFTGIGDATRACGDLPGLAVLLVNCGTPVPTPDVFRRRSGPFSPVRADDVVTTDADALVRDLAGRRNDLTAAAMTIAPGIGTVLSTLDRCRGVRLARMSGSGATCFALLEGADSAEPVRRMLHERHPGWWVAEGRLL